MREIVLDTETTGLDPIQGHRLVEIGCIELLNRIPTGATFHSYLNPERDMPAEAFAIHGLATEFLKDKPRFADIADDFLDFIGDAPLVIHNAGFDHGFLYAELERVERAADRARAAGRHAAAGAAQASGRTEPARRSVRALWHRQFAPHQARRAARRRDPGRGLSGADRRAPGAARPRRERRRRGSAAAAAPWRGASATGRWRPRVTDADRAAHREFVATLGENALWRNYRRTSAVTVRSAAPARARAAPVGLQLRSSSGDRGRRNPPDRAAAAGSRHCARWWR